MRRNRSFGSFRLGREIDESIDFPPPPPETRAQSARIRQQRRHSLRNFGASVRGNIFGREVDESDANPLSEYQQQSLSVFESEHMWAHFKAQLKENKIGTAAGVRAMLPEFVNDRVLDGSVQSDRPVYPASTRSSIGSRSSNHSVDMSGSERRNSIDHSIDDYSQTLRGDAGHVRSLHETVNTEAQKNNSDAKGGLGKVIPSYLTMDNSLRKMDNSSKRSGSLFSSFGSSSFDLSNKKPTDTTASLTLDLSSRLSLDMSSRRSLDLSSKRSLDLSSRRASFLASLGRTKEEPIENNSSHSLGESFRRRSDGDRPDVGRRPKFVRPVESSTDRNITDIIEGNSVQDSNESNDGDDDAGSLEVEDLPFDYRPSRSMPREFSDMGSSFHSALSRSKSEHGRSMPRESSEMGSSFHSAFSRIKSETGRSMPREFSDMGNSFHSRVSRNASEAGSVLLVEWGDNDESSSDDDVESDDEVDERVAPDKLEESERAVVMRKSDLVVDWNGNTDIDDDDWSQDDLDRGISASSRLLEDDLSR